MTDAPYYRPHQEGPMFPEDAGNLVDGAETLLAAADRDVEEAVATQNIHDMAADSFQLWLRQRMQELGLKLPGEAQ